MSKSWQSTLRLPKASIPPRPIPQLQEQYLRRCTDAFYEWQSTNRPADKQFILHDGPPYANGSLHVGHAMNKILKDTILRVKVQQGHRVKYVPSWDCHGLPIELKALEALGVKEMTPVEVRSAARELATNTVLSQMREFRSYAVMADWDGRWTTMDPAFEIRQLELFLSMVRGGLIYRRYKPVYWSPSSGTALAEAELEYKDNHTSSSAYVTFPVASSADGDAALCELLGGGFSGQLYAVIWTTTPWTLPANKAIAVHDDLDYVIIRHGNDALIVGQGCLQQVLKTCFDRTELDQNDVIASCKGSDLRRLVYRHPLHGESAAHQPIIHADFVSAESGSGLVHLAPGHGHDDYEVCRSMGLEVSAPVDNAGHFTADAYPQDPQRLQGLFVQGKGNAAVLELLGDHVLHVHKYQHKYPYDWRTKRPIIVRATAQWFADVAGIKDRALKALDDVQFIPSGGRTRLESFVKGRSEWCISRQRAWGVPIPALYDKNGDAVMSEESVQHIISVIQERGTDAWWSDEADDPVWIAPSLRAQGEYRRGTDTMDVWFDSGSSWTYEGDVQADVYLEGSDQHRGWFQSSLLTRIAAAAAGDTDRGSLIKQTVGLAPFKRLITHGFTLDKQGKKMSKSLGNIISPDQVMNGTMLPPVKKRKDKSAPKETTSKAPDAPQYDALGPDALRLWAASSDYTRDVVIGDSVLKSIHISLIKYRTITKMLLGSMTENARTTPLTSTDHIALIQLRDTMEEVGRAYDNFEFYKGFSLLNRWVNNDLSAFYLEALKDRLYCGDGGGVLEPIFWGFMRMLAPITPVLVEEAWDHAPSWLKKDSVHPLHQLFPSPVIDGGRLTAAGWGKEEERRLREAMPVLFAVHTGIKSAMELARRDKKVGSSLQCSVVLQVPDRAVADMLLRVDELEAALVVSHVAVNEPLPEEEAEWKYSVAFQVPGGSGPVVAASSGASGGDVEGEGKTGGVTCTAWVLPPRAHKCPRCWRYIAPQEEELCGRCEDVVGKGDVE
ncbi:isoleucyl-tRNA synthetase [Diaporthe helianthi]|uniref:Isoleucine--tRNA ligase, mitochondrial n=1 Tax=Diaporthe helianthi TaxID=158607 RepID=A0A2P5HWL2_DIAHE|nr:isoleucyl-tRNA synthetase [Diaporthe helianthi]